MQNKKLLKTSELRRNFFKFMFKDESDKDINNKSLLKDDNYVDLLIDNDFDKKGDL